MQFEYMSGMKWWMQKRYEKHDNMHYINKNYVWKPIYNDENKCINDMLSITSLQDHSSSLSKLSPSPWKTHI